ncbi:Isochorismatase-like protein, partial [Mycena rosella]
CSDESSQCRCDSFLTPSFFPSLASMDPKKRCLLLIDLQNEFLSSGGNFPIAATSQQAIRDIRASGGSVFWVRAEYATGKTTPEALDDLLRGTHTARPRAARPIASARRSRIPLRPCSSHGTLSSRKNWYSAFTGTTLQTELSARGLTHLYLGGGLTNICVRATAEEAQTLGFTVTVLEDCMGWRKYASHEQALRGMRERGIQVAARDEALGRDPHEPALYYVNGSIPSWRVLMALYEKGISFTAIRLRIMSDPKQTRSAAFLELNHRGKTPVFVDPLPNATDSNLETVTINESLAILQYIETYHRPQQPLLPPISQRSARALALARIQESENLHNIYDALEDAHFEAEKRGEHLGPHERAELVANVHAELDYWEAYASRSAYIAGDEFGLADCAFFPLLGYMVHRGFEWERPITEGDESGRETRMAGRVCEHTLSGCGNAGGRVDARGGHSQRVDQRGKANVWTGTRGR